MVMVTLVSRTFAFLLELLKENMTGTKAKGPAMSSNSVLLIQTLSIDSSPLSDKYTNISRDQLTSHIVDFAFSVPLIFKVSFDKTTGVWPGSRTTVKALSSLLPPDPTLRESTRTSAVLAKHSVSNQSASSNDISHPLQCSCIVAGASASLRTLGKLGKVLDKG